jgi:hypothetical protein
MTKVKYRKVAIILLIASFLVIPFCFFVLYPIAIQLSLDRLIDGSRIQLNAAGGIWAIYLGFYSAPILAVISAYYFWRSFHAE